MRYDITRDHFLGGETQNYRQVSTRLSHLLDRLLLYTELNIPLGLLEVCLRLGSG